MSSILPRETGSMNRIFKRPFLWRIWCLFSSPKKLAIPAKEHSSVAASTSWGVASSLAGFQVSMVAGFGRPPRCGKRPVTARITIQCVLESAISAGVTRSRIPGTQSVCGMLRHSELARKVMTLCQQLEIEAQAKKLSRIRCRIVVFTYFSDADAGFQRV